MSDRVNVVTTGNERFWYEGTGRIRRQAYVLHVGDEDIDMDELRCYGLNPRFKILLEKIAPLTALECLWVAGLFAGGNPLQDKIMNELVKLADQAEVAHVPARQPHPEEPFPKFDWGPAHKIAEQIAAEERAKHTL